MENMKEKVLKIKKQIEQTLFDIHNKYSSDCLQDVSEIYDIFRFGETNRDNKIKIKPFLEFYEEFVGLDACYNVETEDIFCEYQKIQEGLEKLLKESASEGECT